MRFSITLKRKERMAIDLNSLYDLGIGMIFDRFHLSGNEDIVNSKSKSSESTAFDFTKDEHSKTSSGLTQ